MSMRQAVMEAREDQEAMRQAELCRDLILAATQSRAREVATQGLMRVTQVIRNRQYMLWSDRHRRWDLVL